jgi:hypothetical protein
MRVVGQFLMRFWVAALALSILVVVLVINRRSQASEEDVGLVAPKP